MSNPKILKKEQWQDLLGYSPWETLKEFLLPVPWFAFAMWASSHQHYWLSVLASAYFFLVCLRVSHNAFHYCLGLSRSTTNGVMLLLSIFMMTSMRAHQFTHIQHHRHCLTEKDIEGHVARQGFWEMLLYAPLFTLRLHIAALTQASSKQRVWIKFELLLNMLWVTAVWLWFDVDALKIHTVIMLLSHAISPLFTVWSVHRDCETKSDKNQYDSRTLRNRFLSVLALNMFYHLEHHAYPAIPTCHLPELARRLDRAGMGHYKTIFEMRKNNQELVET